MGICEIAEYVTFGKDSLPVLPKGDATCILILVTC